MGDKRRIIVNELGLWTVSSEFDSHWVPHSLSLDLNLIRDNNTKLIINNHSYDLSFKLCRFIFSLSITVLIVPLSFLINFFFYVSLGISPFLLSFHFNRQKNLSCK